MKLLRRVSFFILGLMVLVAIVGLFLPDRAHLSRTVSINAPAAKIFPKINSLKNFNDWSPWYERDPNTEYRYEGPEAGVGCKVSWHSEHPQVGTGSQEILESVPDQWVKTHLDFGAQGQATAYFELTEKGATTEVTWGFDTLFGYDILGRYFGLMLEGMLAPDYEAGLSKLKQIVEEES